MIEHRPRTHTLRIDVPLNLDANRAAESWDIQGAMGEALKVLIPLIRLGTLGLLCDAPNVELLPAKAKQVQDSLREAVQLYVSKYRDYCRTGGYEPSLRILEGALKASIDSQLLPNPMKAWGADYTEQTFEP